ncbi:sulfurtransferase [Gloeocapsa sp. PCC 73106]|uniref:sulfurtransferase n=1 Tax=Gloeocapsa sp. PCC 73106 TaxID=102232 RepID=UPI0002AC11A3|nr:sulfurtransferase [Gloeocapsa sp. PCC 73106]ELR98477.1 rhodanese-related sulfurtransferase [Gloeocapsa sp. PCC 73106]
MIQLFTSAQSLLENLNSPNLVILDCRFRLNDPDWGYRQYGISHIPGAYYLDLNRDLSGNLSVHGGRHPLPQIEEIGTKLNDRGVKPDSLIVAYDDANFAFAARLWWLLRYLGHSEVILLDGGFSGWLAKGYPVTEVIPVSQPGAFNPKPDSKKLVDRDRVIAGQNLAQIVLIDSRESDRYLGKREPIDPVAGHISGALNFPWLNLSTPEGYWRSLSEQQQIWHNLPPAQEYIVYCGSGVTACTNLLSLEAIGITNTSLYVGGWSDWCSYFLIE